MLTILPAIDILDGKVVRLQQGDYNRFKEYPVDVATLAEDFKRKGYHWLHLINLSGAKDGGIETILPLLERVALTGINVEVGGGVRTIEDIDKYLSSGAARVIIGTKAFTEEGFVKRALERFGIERIVVGMDVLNGSVRVRGWQEDAGLAMVEAIEALNRDGLKWLLCTDISRDGMLSGVNLDLYREICNAFDGLVIASGGVSSRKDIEALEDLSVSLVNLWGVVVGKALYEGRLSL